MGQDALFLRNDFAALQQAFCKLEAGKRDEMGKRDGMVEEEGERMK